MTDGRTEIILRPGCERDVAAVEHLEQLCFSHPWSCTAISGCIAPGNEILVAECGKNVVGYAIIDTRVNGEVELLRIAVAPDFRGIGIAGRMMEHIIGLSRELGAERMILEVREGNIPALGLYGRYGFKTDGVRRGYYRNPVENAVLMSLRIKGEK